MERFPARSWKDCAAFTIATGLGFGLSPVMPGTVGTLWGLPLAFAIAHLGGLALGGLALGGLAWQLAAIVACFVVGAPICASAARLLGKKDPGAVVWDEIAALPIVFLGIAPERLGVGDGSVADWRIYAAGFVLFRVFDIAKPPPVGTAERLPGGWGIMADDTVAAVLACVCLHGLDWLGAFA